MSECINFKENNNTGIITLNRPKSLNALSLEMCIDFKKILDECKNNNIEGIIIKGEGKAFCAGGDIKKICLSDKNSELKKKFFKYEYELNECIYSFTKPYLSIWNGIVMGGGVGISIYGNYRVATNNTKFAMPESAIGFFPDVGTSYILSRMKKSMGLYLGLTGHILNSEETAYFGLSNYYVNSENLEKLEDYFIKNKFIDSAENNKLPSSNSDIINNQDTINIHFHSMNIENILNSLKSDKSDFSKKTLENLNKKCPVSLALTCELFRRAKKETFKNCLHIDYHLSQIMTNRNDFINGVTEVLINKTHKQIWEPNSYDNIQNIINEFFINISTKKLNIGN